MDLALRISEYSFTLPPIASNDNLVQLVCLKHYFYELYKNLLFLTNRKTQQSKKKLWRKYALLPTQYLSLTALLTHNRLTTGKKAHHTTSNAVMQFFLIMILLIRWSSKPQLPIIPSYTPFSATMSFLFSFCVWKVCMHLSNSLVPLHAASVFSSLVWKALW
jgi:hypothetical protein